MNKKILLINILSNIAFLGSVILLVYFMSPVHETFHHIPCKLSGLSPSFLYFSVDCAGIEEKSHVIQFFFFMGPYIFYLLLLIALYMLSNRYSFLKYFILIPAMDLIINYTSSLKASDFRFLLNNTYPDTFYFIISMVLAALILLLTVRAYFKYRIWDFEFIIK